MMRRSVSTLKMRQPTTTEAWRKANWENIWKPFLIMMRRSVSTPTTQQPAPTENTRKGNLENVRRKLSISSMLSLWVNEVRSRETIHGSPIIDLWTCDKSHYYEPTLTFNLERLLGNPEKRSKIFFTLPFPYIPTQKTIVKPKKIKRIVNGKQNVPCHRFSRPEQI